MVFDTKKITGILILFICQVFSSCDQEEAVVSESIDPIEKYIQQAEDKTKTKEERKKYLDSAYAFYSTLEDNKYKREKINDLSNAFYNLKEFEISKDLDKEMLKLSKQINDSLGLAESYSSLGMHFRKKLNLDSAYYYFYQANKLYFSFDVNSNFEPKMYFYDHGKVLIDLSKLARKVKDYNQSEELASQAIERFKVSGNLSYIPLSYNSLGISSKDLGRYKEAISYYKKTIEYAKNTKKEIFYLSQSNNNIGTVYKSQKKYDLAVIHYLKGLSFTNFLSKNPKHEARLLDNLGYVKFLANKDNDSSLFLFKKAYRIRDSVNDIYGLSTSFLHLSEYYQSQGNQDLARIFAKKSKENAINDRDNDDLLQAYRLLAEISHSNEGQQYAMKYIHLNDSLTQRDNQYKNQFARIRYESDTLQKENEQKSKEIQQVQDQNTIYLLGIVLLCTLIGFVIYFAIQRNKYLKQQSKMIQFQTAYETETRIAKRLHDELGNDIFQVMTQYQNTPNYNPQLLEKLNKSYTKARDISRENSDFEIDETFEEELRNMLQNYTNKSMLLIQRGVDTISWEHTDSTIKIATYRVLQELMTNMQKHSQADRVAVVFTKENKNIHINYSDNGIGMDTTQFISKNGLRNTQKRIEAIGGTITFDTEKNTGFKARIAIPV
ncbi:tetratricopeptide repeat-containing sensor histidine kinase [Aquimarina litoralis]|uniref:tetratricopeptide repeat-containing sensor histidine kinase n=1 Tax=Aquimarina litoralis TaxID=584605 RepID=UPI001C570B9E|nr:tetratricopeptide repeat-containing sensor histidine kinase [Aquimarina litoralis]MBW1297347.1 tetratricopeptide repeat protein [Aquimarina litoralis]